MNGKNAEEMRKKWAEAVAKAWMDESFKARLLKNPKQVLKENGMTLPNDVVCEILENTKTKWHYVIPQKPNEKLSEDALRKLAAGVTSVPNCHLPGPSGR